MQRTLYPLVLWLAFVPVAGVAQGGSVGRLHGTGDAARQAASQSPQSTVQRLEGWHVANQTDSVLVLERATAQPGLQLRPNLTAVSAGADSAHIKVGWGVITRVEPTSGQATRVYLRLRQSLTAVDLDSGIELYPRFTNLTH